jgi:hypothetical protein
MAQIAPVVKESLREEVKRCFRNPGVESVGFVADAQQTAAKAEHPQPRSQVHAVPSFAPPNQLPEVKFNRHYFSAFGFEEAIGFFWQISCYHHQVRSWQMLFPAFDKRRQLVRHVAAGHS